MTDPPASPGHMLSFDVEEYFHAEAVRRGGLDPAAWPGQPRRLAGPVERILAQLAEHRLRATFFILGWVARDQPQVVRAIADAGHEVASHGMSHRMVDTLDRDGFAAELRDSRALLEDLAGRPVRGYRAPTFSVTRRTAWALDALAEAGYAYDSSIFPIRHDRYGVPDAPRWPHRARGPGGGEIVELPPLTLRCMGTNLPAAGGGYLRLFPVWLIGQALAAAQRQGQPGMVYLHPWEFDPDQPVMPMGRLSRFRHRVNLGRTGEKLERLLGRFSFGPASDWLAEHPVAGPAFDYA